jgi:hypothetical protein
MSTRQSTRVLPPSKDSRMKRRPSSKPAHQLTPTPAPPPPKPVATAINASPPKTASSTRSRHRSQHSLPSMAQFTFAPTSTRTIVTTTTTTTTTFPPLVFPPPRPLDDLDPRVHPLATAPTPAALRNFVFSIDGKPTYFNETDDPERSLYEVPRFLLFSLI